MERGISKGCKNDLNLNNEITQDLFETIAVCVRTSLCSYSSIGKRALHDVFYLDICRKIPITEEMPINFNPRQDLSDSHG